MKKSLNQLVTLLISSIMFVMLSGQAGALVSKININTADVKQLSQLQRVGHSYAVRIVEYREKNGDFKTPEDLMKVKGIGKKTFEANREVIVVTDEETAKTE